LLLYANPNIIKIFCHNAIEYAKQDHPKLEPFPFGLQHRNYYVLKAAPTPLEEYREAFFKYLELPEKQNEIMIGWTAAKNNRARKKIPRGPKLPRDEYYDQLAKSRFILSPNGDRPECYRHYEAIGLGTIPITELDPYYHRHLQAAPVLYNTPTWDILDGAAALRWMGLSEYPTVNRNMIFEEYWMEYIERVVGYPLRWWDRNRKRRSYLKDFSEAQA